MNSIRAEAEITEDGGLRLLSPLPAWLKPGRAEIVVMVEDDSGEADAPKRRKLMATPEMLARRKEALEEIRQLDPYREIADPVAWQREIRQDVALPGRE